MSGVDLILLFKLSGDRVHFCLRLFHSDIWLQTRDHLQIVTAAIVCVLRRKSKWNPDFGSSVWKDKVGSHHSDDGVSLFIQLNRLAYNFRVSREASLP